MAEKINNWASPAMKESIVWRDGMSPDEYEIELAYYYGCMKAGLRNDEFEPIWKQELRGVEVQIDDSWASPYFKGFKFYYSGMPLSEYRVKYKDYFDRLNL